MKKFLALAMSLVMLLGILSACGTPNANGTTASPSAIDTPSASNASENDTTLEPASLRMWTFLDLTSANGRAVVLGKLIEQFEAANPGVTVTVETQDWTQLASKTWAAHAAGNAPDILMVNSENLGATISAGCLEPLENLFASTWSDKDYADVESAMWNAGYDGTYHYQVPFFTGVFGIYYRTDVFEDFGIKAADIKSWDDLAKAAQTMTYIDDNGNQVYGLGIGYSTEVVDPHGRLPSALFSQNGGMFTSEGRPNNWVGQAGKEALKWQIDLIDKYACTPSSCVALTSEEIYNAFEAGQYAMIFGGSVRMPTVRGLTAFDPNYVQFMPFPGASISNAAGWHAGVWSGSENKNAAAAFVEHLMSPEADAMWVTEAAQLPLRKSTLETYADIFAKTENAWLAVAAEVVSGSATVAPTDFTVSKYSMDLQTAMNRAYVDGITLEDALTEAEASFIARNVDR